MVLLMSLYLNKYEITSWVGLVQWLKLLTLIPANGVAVFFIVSLTKSLSLCFKCFDQYVKYRMPCGLPSTSRVTYKYCSPLVLSLYVIAIVTMTMTNSLSIPTTLSLRLSLLGWLLISATVVLVVSTSSHYHFISQFFSLWINVFIFEWINSTSFTVYW